MSASEWRDWVLFTGGVLVWAFTAGMMWNKLNTKIAENTTELEKKATQADLDGLGGRVKKVEENCSTSDGRMDRMERELGEYRRDATDAARTAARVEKGVEGLHEEIQQGQLATGVHLSEIKQLIQENDKNTSNRLVRLETVQQIEKKLGQPLPTD